MFRIECKKEKYYHVVGCRNHPHNSYIQLLLKQVLLVSILFSNFLTCFLNFILSNNLCYFQKRILNFKYTFNNYQICLIISIFITLWPIAPTGNFFHNWLNVIYFLPVGFLLSSIYKNKCFFK